MKKIYIQIFFILNFVYKIKSYTPDNRLDPSYILHLNFKMKINNNSFTILNFTNIQMSSFYKRMFIEYEGKAVNNYSQINILPSNKTDDVNCYKNYVGNGQTMCNIYFQENFDNFIVNKVKLPLQNVSKGEVKEKMFVIFENSLSKSNIGFYENSKIEWVNNIYFRLYPFDNYSLQVDISNTFFFFIKII